jgi:hypothetical protein
MPSSRLAISSVVRLGARIYPIMALLTKDKRNDHAERRSRFLEKRKNVEILMDIEDCEKRG